jgi:hypothetical protein
MRVRPGERRNAYEKRRTKRGTQSRTKTSERPRREPATERHPNGKIKRRTAPNVELSSFTPIFQTLKTTSRSKTVKFEMLFSLGLLIAAAQATVYFEEVSSNAHTTQMHTQMHMTSNRKKKKKRKNRFFLSFFSLFFPLSLHCAPAPVTRLNARCVCADVLKGRRVAEELGREHAQGRRGRRLEDLGRQALCRRQRQRCAHSQTEPRVFSFSRKVFFLFFMTSRINIFLFRPSNCHRRSLLPDFGGV